MPEGNNPEQPSLVNAPQQLLKDYIFDRMRKEGLRKEHVEFYETEHRGVHTHQYTILGKEYVFLFELDWWVVGTQYKHEFISLIEQASGSDFSITFDGRTTVLDNLCSPQETVRVLRTSDVDPESIKKVQDHFAKITSLEEMAGKDMPVKDPLPFLNHYLDIFVRDYKKRTIGE